MSGVFDVRKLVTEFNCDTGAMDGAASTKRYLSDLRGCFHDASAYERALAQNNSLVYTVSAIEPASGDGDLHFGLGAILPGIVGDEYFLTKGHLHTWRDAAELYIGVRGEGMMLLQDETSGETAALPLRANGIVYVPGHTAHRTVNVGDDALVYIGVYPARAGHDYGSLERNNFRTVLVKRQGKPQLLQRNEIK